MERPLEVVLIEDDHLVIELFKSIAKDARLTVYGDIFVCLENVKKNHDSRPDVFIVDLCTTSDPTGERAVEALCELRLSFPKADIVVESGILDPQVMRQCLNNGATYFVMKEFFADELPKILSKSKKKNQTRELLWRKIPGESKAILKLRDDLQQSIEARNFDVLIEGETGVGKELCAQALSLITQTSFVAVNVAAVPKDLFESEFFGAMKGAYSGSLNTRIGYFEKAQNGVLFLDEVQNLSLDLQAKLLRVLETRRFRRVGSTEELEFGGRVVSASNRCLLSLVAKGEFREDLYYRLAGLKIRVPNLQERIEDIPLLVSIFLDEMNPSKRFSQCALNALMNLYRWPGNIRELKAFVRDLAIISKIPLIDAIEVEQRMLTRGMIKSALKNIQTPSPLEEYSYQEEAGFDANVSQYESQILSRFLERYSSKEAREKLKMSRSRFYEKLKAHNLSKDRSC